VRELIKIVVFLDQELVFKSVYITQTFGCPKFEVNYLSKAAKLITGVVARFLPSFVAININIHL
jgi:hypothetical protein